MSIKIFDQQMNIRLTAFLFAGKSGAGERDLRRLFKLYPESVIINRKAYGIIKSLSKLANASNIVYIHSSPWNVIYRIIYFWKCHFLIVHNPPGFTSRTHVFGYLDVFILKINIAMANRLLFISKHVLNTYAHKHKCELLTVRKFVTVSEDTMNTLRSDNENPSIFFFGRYLPYKNVELFYELSKKFIDFNFYIYSSDCPLKDTENLKVYSNWLTEDEVDAIYEKHQILVTPYTETSQSGPFFIGLETRRIIIAPNIPGFKEYQDTQRVILYSPNDIANLMSALQEALVFFESERLIAKAK